MRCGKREEGVRRGRVNEGEKERGGGGGGSAANHSGLLCVLQPKFHQLQRQKKICGKLSPVTNLNAVFSDFKIKIQFNIKNDQLNEYSEKYSSSWSKSTSIGDHQNFKY